MKKTIALVLTLALVFSVTVVPAAASGNTGKYSQKGTQTTTTTPATGTEEAADATADAEDTSTSNGKNEGNVQKRLKDEITEQKKQLQQQKSTLTQQKEKLEAEYETLIKTGDTAGAAELQVKLDALKTQIAELQAQFKQTINQRYMLAKTMYSDEELAQFESVADLIAQMYKDASVLQLGSVTMNNNLIKFDAPPYVKGGTTLVPIRAIVQGLGAHLAWDADTKTVTITKDDKVIEIKASGTAVLVNGTPAEIGVPAEFTCGRTYIPLRFIAEALNFEVTWDSESEEIVIESGDDSTVSDAVSSDTTTGNSVVSPES